MYLKGEEEFKNIRFYIPLSVYERVKQVQHILAAKRKKDVTMQETYTKLMDQSARDILKKNKI